LAILLRDGDGQLTAGIYGWLWGAYLEIECLWVEKAMRGQGAGRRLVQKLEAATVSRGAHTAVLDTFSFQAPGFYEKLGYEVFGIVEGYGDDHDKRFMRKRLS
jgi:ribosomal protein S18 acetylase RimI-like enzyme